MSDEFDGRSWGDILDELGEDVEVVGEIEDVEDESIEERREKIREREAKTRRKAKKKWKEKEEIKKEIRGSGGREVGEVRRSEIAVSGGLVEMDFSKMFDKAVEIFNEQMGFDKDPKDIKLADLELSRAKAKNYIEAIANIAEISHQVEVLKAERDKFKRSDELGVLNSLMRTLQGQASITERSAQMIQDKMDEYESDMSQVGPEELALLQTVLQSNIDTTSKIIAGTSRLIQVERLSGGRSWGRSGSGGERISVGLLPPKEVPGRGAGGKKSGEEDDEGEGQGSGNAGERKVREISIDEAAEIVRGGEGVRKKDRNQYKNEVLDVEIEEEGYDELE